MLAHKYLHKHRQSLVKGANLDDQEYEQPSDCNLRVHVGYWEILGVTCAAIKLLLGQFDAMVGRALRRCINFDSIVCFVAMHIHELYSR